MHKRIKVSPAIGVEWNEKDLFSFMELIRGFRYASDETSPYYLPDDVIETSRFKSLVTKLLEDGLLDGYLFLFARKNDKQAVWTIYPKGIDLGVWENVKRI